VSKKPDGRTPKSKPFIDVSMPGFFPQNEVADHQVYMSFKNDGDAIAFREWWDGPGCVLFNSWLEKQRKE